MKCPNCGNELVKGNMYCEFCGEDIHIVPDFDPEIENSIKETLSTVAKDLSPSGFDENKLIHNKPDEKKSIFNFNKKKIIISCIIFIIMLIIPVFILQIQSYKDNSAEVQNKKAMEELCMIVQIGKNEHDDSADGLVQLLLLISGESYAKCEAMKRPC